ncbi:MAG: ZIP family metal transporter [Microgenomates group bacterium]
MIADVLPILPILGLVLFGSVMALVGGVLFLYVTPLTKTLTKYSVPFAAGVLLTAALVGLLPESTHQIGETAFLVTLMAFIGSYVFEKFATSLHHHDDGHHHYDLKESSIWMVLVGDTIHNFIDGVAIAASYLVNPGLGVVTAVSTFLHEVPHEIGDFGILLKAGWEKRSIIIVNVVSALFTVLGAGAVLFVFDDSEVIGYLLAIAAGMFLYLGASDFLPKFHDENTKMFDLSAFIFGTLVILGVFYAIPHEHPSHDEDLDHDEQSLEEHGDESDDHTEEIILQD